MLDHAVLRLLYQAVIEYRLAACPPHTLCNDCKYRKVCRLTVELMDAIEELKKGLD